MFSGYPPGVCSRYSRNLMTVRYSIIGEANMLTNGQAERHLELRSRFEKICKIVTRFALIYLGPLTLMV